jgi:hypothetical protein
MFRSGLEINSMRGAGSGCVTGPSEDQRPKRLCDAGGNVPAPSTYSHEEEARHHASSAENLDILARAAKAYNDGMNRELSRRQAIEIYERYLLIPRQP